ncbi:hypothetical protein, variant [Saprolegnia diclina VS20]|uniref:Uncharacterized protein n=1 Tax=Saprolegnia diclina (strain VS20) TaxID=1156394 RepID=T0S1L4_SAPDV|nr:hypothetical protein, variant [Saprolegnia diclina VS20]XP_008609973.1 hypothetical protein SDRG_06000 [Saprolegnia diclina VS20]EQC36551.1 hypothetical protein SDRG_06000 [Saprolegnia diclina VS20]EQC36552.1 hypothetical protein, variant [Saprolegnia diclina VS20]|eukprot:XP_008609972.1 hypothetical protein, variant [Saprolegnia diclina VS20]
MAKAGDRSTIAAYIERFRGPATSRQERARSREASKREFWWIADEKETEEHGVEAIDDAASVEAASVSVASEMASHHVDDDLEEEEEKPAEEDQRQEHSVVLSEPPSPPASPVASDMTQHDSRRSLDRDEHEEKAPYDEQAEKASYGEQDLWASLSPLSSPKHDDSSALSGRHDDFEAISVDSSLTDTVGPQWYVRPEEVLIEDPEVTIQRLRQRLGLSGFDPARQHVEWNAPLTFPDWSQAIDDYMHLDNTDPPGFPSPAFFQVGASFADEMPQATPLAVAVDICEHPEQPAPATVIAPSSPLASPLVAPLDNSPYRLDPPAPTPEHDDIAPEVTTINLQVAAMIEMDQQAAHDAASPTVPSREPPTSSTAPSMDAPALPPRPPRRGIAFGKVLAPLVVESMPQAAMAQLDSVAENETSVPEDTAPTMLASIMDDLVTSVVTSWVDPAPAPATACEPRESPALPAEPPILAKDTPALAEETLAPILEPPILHEEPPKAESLAQREDDVKQTECSSDADPMDSIAEFLDDDIVRALVHRVLVCEEALAILRARAVMQIHATG